MSPQGYGLTSKVLAFLASSSAATWFLLDSTYPPLCYDFLPDFTLLSHWPKHLYSSTNKSHTHTEDHPTSSPLFCLNKKEGFNFNIKLHIQNSYQARIIVTIFSLFTFGKLRKMLSYLCESKVLCLIYLL